MNKIKLYCDNGLFLWTKGDSYSVRTTCDVKDELCLHETLIPKETLLKIEYCEQSLYGVYIYVDYRGNLFAIKPKYVEGICEVN